jgi:hypothetical protein
MCLKLYRVRSGPRNRVDIGMGGTQTTIMSLGYLGHNKAMAR